MAPGRRVQPRRLAPYQWGVRVFQPLLRGVEEFWGVLGGPPRRASSASRVAVRVSTSSE
jgi:hypothetical protein